MVQMYIMPQAIDNVADSVESAIPKGAEYPKVQTHSSCELYKKEINL
jgi:hypothetical protein